MCDDDLPLPHPILLFILLTIILAVVIAVIVTVWALVDPSLGKPEADEESLVPQNNQT
jgi:p-aminobenzoyl-glutamate transporter AbgT